MFSRWGIERVPMFPSRAVCGLLLAILALVSALDGYAAYAAPIFKKAGYAQSSHANAALALMAPAVSDDGEDGHGPGAGDAPPLLISEPLERFRFRQNHTKEHAPSLRKFYWFREGRNCSSASDPHPG